MQLFFLQSWVCAGRECFFTWAFLGPVLVQLASHNRSVKVNKQLKVNNQLISSKCPNRWRHRVIRDTTLVVVLTLAVLVLSGLLGVAITHMLNPRYQYTVSSFGECTQYGFMRTD